MSPDTLQFSLNEVVSLIGLTQAVYILVYMAFRAGSVRDAFLPFLYFFCLGMAFLLDFAANTFGRSIANYDLAQWFFWYAGPPLSVLLIFQVARVGQLPGQGEWWVAMLPFIGIGAALLISEHYNECVFPGACPVLRDWLTVTGPISGLCGMAYLWMKRILLTDVLQQKAGRERYWLILMLILVNLFSLGVMLLAGFINEDRQHEVMMIRTVTGILLCYLAGTSLFRIYPQTVQLKPNPKQALNANEQAVAEKIRNLIDLDKVYQEPAYNRSDLARELNLSEGAVSRIINEAYGRTFPQLINERRVEDAKRLLAETDAPVKIVAQEVGFNSLASFNRVFKELSGQNPTDYRQSLKKTG